jgi:CDP-paratose 2-epimerase
VRLYRDDEMNPIRQAGRGSEGPALGILEWIRVGEYDCVERLLQDLKALGVTELRTGISWADSYLPEGREWIDWLLPRLAREVNVLPCFLYTPPSEGLAPKVSSPPRNLKLYADFVGEMIERYGEHFEYVELWNEPNNLSEWDWILDPGWLMFAEMVGNAAYWARHLGKKTVLGGMSPIDPEWIALMCDYGLMSLIDAVGVHGFPGGWEHGWEGWPVHVGRIREVLAQRGFNPEIWITETGFSTWQHDPHGQLQVFVEALEAPVQRMYWYAAYDLDPDIPTISGFHLDEREYHFGLRHADGRPKPLYHLWATGGVEAVKQAVRMGEPARVRADRRRATLITGGAGFIGTNLAHRLLSQGQPVIVYDNLSRPGVERNLHWLRDTHDDLIQIEIADVRDRFSLRRAVERADMVFHLAAQVAVTKSLQNPIYDFDVNVRGTLNLLEEMRALENPPPLIYTSTNKVYGDLADLSLTLNSTRYEPLDGRLKSCGINEGRPLDFSSPYGCSKGAADQYVLDYAHTFGLPAVVFRMSCIYGPHQFGTEDQGWIAHFLIRALEGRPITIFGDGLQVRDALYIDDLLNAFLQVPRHIESLAGQMFNIGGGSANTLSLLELVTLITEIHGRRPTILFDNWRAGDQRFYVSDISRFQRITGWSPQVGIHKGVKTLYDWLVESYGVTSEHSSLARMARSPVS